MGDIIVPNGGEAPESAHPEIAEGLGSCLFKVFSHPKRSYRLQRPSPARPETSRLQDGCVH